MEVKNLLESSNTYKSMQADANKLAQKWAQSGLLEGIKDERTANNMAVILENQAKQIVAEANSTNVGGGSFTAGAGEQWAGVALPLVRKVFAQIVAQDFVSVQPMNLPSGLVFYLDFKYGSAVNGRADGDNMYGNVSTANSKLAVDTDAAGGLYGAGQFGYSINQVSPAAVAAAVTTADSASVNYEVGISPASYEEVAVALSAISGYDAEGIRAFRFTSKSVDIPVYAQYTKIQGSNIIFVTAAGAAQNTGQVVVKYHKQPVDNDRGDFEADSTVAVDTSISIPEIDVNQAQIQRAIAAAAVPFYQRNFALTENALSVLLGQNPKSIPTDVSLYNQNRPDSIPVGMPSTILRRRPDILKAEQDVISQSRKY